MCPECADALVPAQRLTELVGFRRADVGERSTADASSGHRSEPRDTRIADITAYSDGASDRNSALHESWGESIDAGAMSLALPPHDS